MKKIIVFILMITFCCMSGCVEDDNNTGNYNDEAAKELSENIIAYFEREDENGIKALFCQEVQESHDLAVEIQGAFEFIDGEIVSYDTPQGSTGGGIIEDGKRTELSLRGKITNIETDTGKTYSIYSHSYAINEEQEDYIGVTYINIFLAGIQEAGEDDSPRSEYTIGEYVE